jgi:glucokinase
MTHDHQASTVTEESPRLIFDLGGTRVRTALVNESGTIVEGTRRSEKIARTITTREGLRDLLVAEVMSRGLGQDTHVLSLAGPISADNRVIRKYTNVLPREFDIPISDLVEREIRRRTAQKISFFVIKDAIASTMAEMGPTGAAFDRSEVIALILGTGTGGAPCRRGRNGVVDFPDALADLGHHQLDPRNTEPCNCGSRGCVELQTSGTGVVRTFNRRAIESSLYAESVICRERGRAPGSIGAEDIAWAAARGDPFTIALLQEAALALALLVRNILTSHPGMTIVLVGGFALGVGTPLLMCTRAALRDIGLPFMRKSDVEDFVAQRLLLGKIPADDTNLTGARLFLRQVERNA